jgi:hypothetical protein
MRIFTFRKVFREFQFTRFNLLIISKWRITNEHCVEENSYFKKESFYILLHNNLETKQFPQAANSIFSQKLLEGNKNEYLKDVDSIQRGISISFINWCVRKENKMPWNCRKLARPSNSAAPKSQTHV